MADDVRVIPDTPEAAREALAREAVRALTAADAAMGVRHAPYGRYEGDALVLLHAEVGAVARLVLSDPEGWREALGLDHLFLASDALGPDTRCDGCGVRLADVSDSDICPGVPS